MKYIVYISITGTIVLICDLLLVSFTTYAEPITSSSMQNIYIQKILYHGIPILVLQIILMITFFLSKKPKTEN